MTALAEALWSSKENLGWEDFRSRLESQLDRFDAMGANYSEGSYGINFITEFDEARQQFMVTFEVEHLNADIRYTLDGTEPVATSTKYEKPLIINQTSTIKAAIFTNGIINETFSEKIIVFHQGIGSRVSYKIQPEPQYPGQGEKTLVDGLKGSQNHRDGNWQGFNGNDLDINIDLGSEKTVNTVSASFHQSHRNWIFLPTGIEVSLSIDGTNFTTAKTAENTVPPKTDGAFSHDLAVTFAGEKAKFIHLKAKNLGVCPAWHGAAGDKAWLFVDEVVVE